MKRLFSSFAAIALVGAMAATAMAQDGTGIPPAPPNEGAVTRFDNGYLDKHPDIAQRLARDPGLADNQQYLASHPQLSKYLADHPQVRTELQQHPDRFMHAESRAGSIENKVGPEARFDRGYLDQHPEVAQQLAHDPRLANNQQFLAAHPGLGDYLANHPHVRTGLQEHPKHFMQAESHFENNENSRSGWGSHPIRNWRQNHRW